MVENGKRKPKEIDEGSGADAAPAVPAEAAPAQQAQEKGASFPEDLEF